MLYLKAHILIRRSILFNFNVSFTNFRSVFGCLVAFMVGYSMYTTFHKKGYMLFNRIYIELTKENETFFFQLFIVVNISFFVFFYIGIVRCKSFISKKGRLTTQYRLRFNSVNDQTNCRLTV